MCGIIGLYDNSLIDVDRFSKELDGLKYRGPDNQSVHLINKKLIFGHTRLSIIDLDEKSNQPFLIDNYFITYNGEIFNYIEIKEELKSLGIKFKTESDTEVILQSYILWGQDCVKKFNGMWAFSIYDPIENILFCSRDRYGIKPFYYFVDQNRFMFSSMITSIISYYPELKKPNFACINEFLYRGLISQFDDTWFIGIKKLLPGQNLIYDFKSINLNYYYQRIFEKKKKSFEELKHEFLKLFEDSINLRMRSDVEVSSTLTSGIDSSSIVSLINKNFDQKLNTYTVFSDEKNFTKNDKKDFNTKVDFDESKALIHFKNYNINSNLIELSFDFYFENLKHCIKYIESGHASPAIVGINELYKGVNKKGHKVLLEGQGADEIFGGYVTDFLPVVVKKNIFNIPFLFKLFFRYRKVYSVKQIIFRFFNSLKDNNILIYFKIISNKINVSKSLSFKRPRKKENLFDFHQFETLPNLLFYGDALSMSNSIETRFPFLDYRIVDFSNSLSIDDKINLDKGKYIVREGMKKFLPEEIYKSKVKNGFSTPIDKILKNSNEIKAILYDKREFEFFESKKLKKVLDKYYSNKSNNHHFIFKILTTKLWFEEFFNEN